MNDLVGDGAVWSEPKGLSADPPVADPYRWEDWTADAYVSVTARTPEEAHERIRDVLGRVNEDLKRDGGRAIIKLVNEHQLPEPS